MTKTIRLRRRFCRAAQSGAIKPWMLIVLLLALAPLLTLGFYEGRKAYWDAKVREMCAKDGGIVVFERVSLSAKDVERLGGKGKDIPLPERRSAGTEAKFVSETQITVIRPTNPEIRRYQVDIYAVEDNRRLAQYIAYSRGGGDFPTYAHPSSYACNSEITSIGRQVFTIEGEAQ